MRALKDRKCRMLLAASLGCAMTFVALGTASAQGIESMTLAQHLGSALAAETFCGLSHDQAAISDFIAKHVKRDDLGFASTVNLMTGGMQEEQKSMSPSSKTAYCSQTARVARSYGFIK